MGTILKFKLKLKEMNNNAWSIPIYESKNSEKVIAFANKGYGMSKKWWTITQNLDNNGLLHGVYKTSTGLKRNIK